MALIHHTTLTPTKLELLAAWLPTQDWYRGSETPQLRNAGGFRLDDPAGEVGIEVMIVADAAGTDAYLVPMTYRDAPIAATLVGTLEHGVLGTRYVYDAPTDPVFRAQAVALLRGEVMPQAQTESDTLDRTARVGISRDAGDVEVLRHLRCDPAAMADRPGVVSTSWLDENGRRRRGVVLRAAGRLT